MTEVQEEDWARTIIINGGQSVSKTMSDDKKNALPLLDVLEDEDLMKELIEIEKFVYNLKLVFLFNVF